MTRYCNLTVYGPTDALKRLQGHYTKARLETAGDNGILSWFFATDDEPCDSVSTNPFAVKTINK